MRDVRVRLLTAENASKTSLLFRFFLKTASYGAKTTDEGNSFHYASPGNTELRHDLQLYSMTLNFVHFYNWQIS